MLNTSYRLIKKKNPINPNANGNAWFVNDVKLVNKSNTEMKMLDKLNTKKAAILIFICMETNLKIRLKRNLDTSGTIKIDIYKPNYIKYTSNNENEGLAVFLKSIMKMDGMPISMVRKRNTSLLIMC
jgi:hypothetical protein